jgi:photosystem II stability/assembly factor-like uncharacterized protein
VEKWTFGLALLSVLASGCTFYTSCPDPNRGPANNGGSAPTGGSGSSGGSSSPPLAAWQNVTNNLAGLDSVCGNLTVLVAKPDNVLLAGVAPNRLFATTDGGENWNEMAKGKGTEPINGGIRSVTFDPSNPDVYWLSCIYGQQGIWRTEDNGNTFKILGSIRHNDLVDVDFGDPDRKVLVAGGHEANKALWRSVDGGENWSDIGSNLPDDSRASSYPLVLGPEVHLLGAAGYGPGNSGIFRTEDGGATWERVSTIGGFGKPLVLEDGTILWPGDEGTLNRSTDQGLTWEEVLPRDSVMGYQSVLQLPDGRVAVVSRYEGIKISDDGFATVRQVTARVPWDTAGFTYSVPNLAFYAWHSDCGEKVLDDAVMRVDFDYTQTQ